MYVFEYKIWRGVVEDLWWLVCIHSDMNCVGTQRHVTVWCTSSGRWRRRSRNDMAVSFRTSQNQAFNYAMLIEPEFQRTCKNTT